MRVAAVSAPAEGQRNPAGALAGIEDLSGQGWGKPMRQAGRRGYRNGRYAGDGDVR